MPSRESTEGGGGGGGALVTLVEVVNNPSYCACVFSFQPPPLGHHLRVYDFFMEYLFKRWAFQLVDCLRIIYNSVQHS